MSFSYACAVSAAVSYRWNRTQCLLSLQFQTQRWISGRRAGGPLATGLRNAEHPPAASRLTGTSHGSTAALISSPHTPPARAQLAALIRAKAAPKAVEHTSRCSTVLTANCCSISSAFPAVSASKGCAMLLMGALRLPVFSSVACTAFQRDIDVVMQLVLCLRGRRCTV